MTHRKPNITGTSKMLTHLGFHGDDDLLVPLARKPASRAIFSHPKIIEIRRFEYELHFCLKSLTSFFPVWIRTSPAEIHLIDNGQHWYLKQNRV